MVIRVIVTIATLLATVAAKAQPALTLDSCRTLALKNNKQVQIAQLQEKVAQDIHRAATTARLPRINAEGSYLHTPHKTHLLSSHDRKSLQNMGTTVEGTLSAILPQLPQNIISAPLNSLGSSIADALTLDTRNIFAVSINITQPLYLGGKIAAYNKLTKIAGNIARNSTESTRQDIIVTTEQAYWTVVSLVSKEQLATSYVTLTNELCSNVGELKQQGMATTADLLKVNVKQNEARTTLLKVKDALSLARMTLCYICGLPLDSTPTLADEEYTLYTPSAYPQPEINNISNRPELKILQLACEAAHQENKITRSDYLPQIALTAGYLISNPNLIDGFRRTFRGTWNIGIMAKIPIWNWGEGKYKIRSAKTKEVIAHFALQEAQEAMNLQLQQSQQQLHQANERYRQALCNIDTANENLRNANIAFAEGVYTSEEVMQAQTAWLQAHSTLIDARIDIMVAHTQLLRTSGNLVAD